MTHSMTCHTEGEVALAQSFLARMVSPDAVSAVEALMLEQPQRDLGTQSVMHGRMCARTIFIPAGTVLTGAVTNIDNTCIVCGDISVTTDAGVVRLTGYNVITARAGAKRIGIAHADTYWTTVWHTDTATVREAEDELTPEADMLQTRRSGINYERIEL